AAVYHRLREFMDDFELLLAPVTQVAPFPFEIDYPRRVAGVEMDTYLDWMESCWRVSVTGLPALSVPGGFTATGLPVGLQVIGRPRDELGVLSFGLEFERVTGHWRRRPPSVS
ncbi:MAG TPA: amidase family protein, partial [Gaiellales bacterium]|nr:amidase family protein [Gaiellales bacterium]